jgi:hypothetical protein
MNSEVLYKALKYILGGALIYFTLNFVSKDKLQQTDIGLIVVIAILIFVIIEYAYDMFNKKQESSPSCSSRCNIEGMVSVQNDYNTTRETLLSELATKQLATNPAYVIPSDKIARNADGSYEVKPYRNPQITNIGTRPNDDVVKSETQYHYTDYNNLPPNVNEGTFEYGYSFLPPEKWYPQPPHPPVCVSEKKCPVCPVFTNGIDIDLKEWDSARRVMPPDQINVQYVQEKLNSGR